MRDATPDLSAVCAGFAFGGEPLAATPLGAGHIHDTFAVTCGLGAARRRWVLQRINERVFPDVAGLMDNVARVTCHLRARLAAAGAPDAARRALALAPTRDGAAWLRDERGSAWRAFAFIEGAVSRPGVATAAEAHAVGRAFGAFQRALADLPPPPLREHLPGFHDGRARESALAAAVAADPLGRAARADAELATLRRFSRLGGFFGSLAALGVPPRPVHNDTKPDNLLRDAATGEPLCVIDLDTVMPGQGLADFGDLARAACARVPEDEPDPARVAADPDLFTGLAAGFLAGTGDLLTASERDHLVEAAMALAWEQGARFLTDWLTGDAYYRARRPDHNLERCRAQLALLRSLAKQGGALRSRLARIAVGRGPA